MARPAAETESEHHRRLRSRDSWVSRYRLVWPFFLTLCLLPLLAGCTSDAGLPSPSDSESSVSITTTSSSTAAGVPETTTPATSALQRPTEPDARFYELVLQRIEGALVAREQEVTLTPVFRLYAIHEDLMPEVWDRIYLDYQDIYQKNAGYFYLNGSFSMEYGVGAAGNRSVETAGLRLEYWPSLSDLSSEELQRYIDEVEDEAGRWADDIRGMASEPWRQLAELHDRLARHVTFDYNSEAHAGWALLQGRTICGGYSQAFQLVCGELGYSCCLIAGLANGSEHIWNQVFIDGRAYHVDVTLDDVLPDDCVDSAARHRYLLRSDTAMEETHEWVAARYPCCPTDCLLYYSENGLVAANRRALTDRLESFVKGLDFGLEETHLLELVYQGEDTPDVGEFTQLVEEVLSRLAKGGRYSYRAGVQSGVVFLEIGCNRAE